MRRWFALLCNPHSWATVLLLLAILVSGCSRGGQEAHKPRVAVVVKALDSEFWLEVKNGVEAAAREHPEVEVSIMAPPREIDIDQQVALLENQLVKKVSALVVAPAGVAQVVPVLERARRAYPGDPGGHRRILGRQAQLCGHRQPAGRPPGRRIPDPADCMGAGGWPC